LEGNLSFFVERPADKNVKSDAEFGVRSLVRYGAALHILMKDIDLAIAHAEGLGMPMRDCQATRPVYTHATTTARPTTTSARLPAIWNAGRSLGCRRAVRRLVVKGGGLGVGKIWSRGMRYQDSDG
jgi:hypothetical protein